MSPVAQACRPSCESYAATSFHGARRSLTNLPEGVFARDLAAGELKKVDSPYFKTLPRHRGAGKCPFGYSHITTDPVLILAVVHIRNPHEAFGKAGTHFILTDVTAPLEGWHLAAYRRHTRRQSRS